MSGFVGRSMLAVVSVVVSLLVADWVLEQRERSKHPDSDLDPEPFYSWSFTTTRGERVGLDGLLELSMHPFVVYTNLPNQETRYFSTDGSGFRRNGPARDTKARFRIAVLGGSTAFGTGLQRDADTFTARLESLVEGSAILNAAVIGHLSGQELVYLVTELVDLEPHLVIAIDGFNDVADQMMGPSRTSQTAGVNNTFFMIEDGLQRLYLLESGGLLDRLGAAIPLIFKHIAKIVRSALDLPPPSLSPNPGNDERRVLPRNPAVLADIYARNMGKMVIVAEAFGARLLCVLQPDYVSLFEKHRPNQMSLYYTAFRRAARPLLDEAGVVHIDLNNFEDSFLPDMFMDQIHLNARGNQVMAEIVESEITTRNLLTAE
jgi:lysophospholipase L1-like esterase